ncbi:MAG TPA: SDR family NAD(P)-dependent oxidoreductase [Vineibacter sp.]|nr:SDR family NAD(P)-dependent oxidoreductase [Vineibacter sp.]
MDDAFDLAGKTALVTGAGQGVGRETAHLLAARGALVIVNDFHAERAEAVVQEINAGGGRAVAIAADVTDFAGVRRMVQQAHAATGPIDILVNNAGNAGPEAIGDLPKFWETDPTEWQRWLGTNLYGVMNCCHAVLPGMIERQVGRIVTVISDAGRVGDANFVVYSGAKAGAAGFMRGLARAVGRYNVAANCVSLAAIQTPGLAARLEDPERRRKILGNYVIRRLGQPSDAAHAILFLASNAAAWVTGQTYAVNGGFAFSA